MKTIDGHICRVYGNEKTHLTLTDKAEVFYSNSSPLAIYERKIDREDKGGNIIDAEYLYTICGIIETRDARWRRQWLTEDDVNALFEEEADEIAGEAAAEYFWDLDGWGSDYPPENADEIIQKANDKIVEWAVAHYWERGADVGEYASQLWEHYCSTGRID